MGFIPRSLAPDSKLKCNKSQNSRKNIKTSTLDGWCSSTYHHKSSSSSLRMIFGGDSLPSSLYLAAIDSSISQQPGLPASQIFEPQTNIPALFSFMIILVIFTLLQYRISRISDAATRREEALLTVRKLKSQQLSSNNMMSTPTDEIQSNQNILKAAIDEYERSLNQELKLRTLLPGVRIVAPNDPKKQLEEKVAAKQFLGINLDDDDDDNEQDPFIKVSSPSSSSTLIDDDDETVRTKLLLQSRRRFDGKQTTKPTIDEQDEYQGLSNGSKIALLAIALVQIMLLVLLSSDPMTAHSILNTIGDNTTPPPNIPLSSWSIE